MVPKVKEKRCVLIIHVLRHGPADLPEGIGVEVVQRLMTWHRGFNRTTIDLISRQIQNNRPSRLSEMIKQ
jgi:hypothetical protein